MGVLKSIYEKILFLLLFVFILTSCIEITQEIQLKKNGSGIATYTMDMSKMQEMLEPLKSSFSDSLDLNSVNIQYAEYAENIKSVEGISKVKFTSKNFLYKISFQFKNLEALNKVLTYLNNGKSGLEQSVIEYVKIDNKQIIVKNSHQVQVIDLDLNNNKTYDNKKENNEMGDIIINENSETFADTSRVDDMIKSFFIDSNYTTIIQVYGKVVSTSHQNAQVSGKKVTLKIPLLDLDKPENIQNIIILK